jgi:hypothetical protein
MKEPRDKLYKPPEPAGYYNCNDFRLMAFKKPTIFHQWMARLLLGWVWHDIKETT